MTTNVWRKEVSSDEDCAAAIEDSSKAGESALGAAKWSRVDLVVNAETVALLDAHRPEFAAALRVAGRLVVDATKPAGAFWVEREVLS